MYVRAIVPCRMDFRDGVGALLEALCDGLDRSTMYQVVSAFNEAFNNIVHHSRLGDRELVEIEAEREPDSIVLRVIDDGVGFPPDVDRWPGEEMLAQNLPERGMGLLIINRCMDEISFERTDRNRLTMVKRLAASSIEATGGAV